VGWGIEGCNGTPSRATHEAVDGALDSRESRLTGPQVMSAPGSLVRLPKIPKHDPKRRWPPFRPKVKGRQMSSNLASRHLMRWVNTSRSRFLKIFNFGPMAPLGRCVRESAWGRVWSGYGVRVPGRFRRSQMARWTRERPVFQFRRSAAPQDPGFESPKFPNMDPNAGGAPVRPQGKVHQMT
jgi:hypothetical protein